MIIFTSRDPGSGPAESHSGGPKKAKRAALGGYFAVFAAVLVLAAGCDGASATRVDAGNASNAAANASAIAIVTDSEAPSPASSSPSARPASPVAVRTTHHAATKTATKAYTPVPAPVHTTKAPQPVRTTTRPQSCYPHTNSGKCYTPGEFCRATDHGKSGIDASGDAIKCEDNNDWRWERV